MADIKEEKISLLDDIIIKAEREGTFFRMNRASESWEKTKRGLTCV